MMRKLTCRAQPHDVAQYYIQLTEKLITHRYPMSDSLLINVFNKPSITDFTNHKYPQCEFLRGDQNNEHDNNGAYAWRHQ